MWFGRIVKIVGVGNKRSFGLETILLFPMSIKVSILGRQIGTSNWLPNLYFDLLRRKDLSSKHVPQPPTQLIGYHVSYIS